MIKFKHSLIVLSVLLLTTSCASTNNAQKEDVKKQDQEVYLVNSPVDYNRAYDINDKSSQATVRNTILGLGASLLKFPMDGEVRAVARTFSDSGNHPHYVYLVITSGVKNISAVRAASDAFMCNFISVQQSDFENRNVAILIAPVNTNETNNLKSGVDLLNNYDFEKSRALHKALADKTVKKEGFDSNSNVYLVGSRFSLNITNTPAPQITNKRMPKMSGKTLADEIISDKLLILPLDSYTPGEIGRVFEGVRLKLIGREKLEVGENVYEYMEEHETFTYFRKIIDYVPTLISRASANSKACASS